MLWGLGGRRAKGEMAAFMQVGVVVGCVIMVMVSEDVPGRGVLSYLILSKL